MDTWHKETQKMDIALDDTTERHSDMLTQHKDNHIYSVSINKLTFTHSA
jgi:hypothetical protein